jgi:hypothetical protein
MYFGTKDAFHHLERVKDLGNNIDGSLKWRPRAEFDRRGRKDEVGCDVTVEYIVDN